MKLLSSFTFLLLFFSCAASCHGQPAAGPATATAGKGASAATAVDTSAAWKEGGQQLLLTGIVYQPGGSTPAAGVVLYYYHTNAEGRYVHDPAVAHSMPPNGLGQTHGYIRGWVKTGADGRYSIYTIRPGSYPSADEPAHVHMTVKEPNGMEEYYIDDIVFDDDRLLTAARRRKMENRGGSGVVRLVRQGGLAVGERNVMLGLHIPGHPAARTKAIAGRAVGEDVFSFIPYHAWGPDKGTRTCPVCKYGWYHGILYFVGNRPQWEDIRQWLSFLEAESMARKKYLKVYFIYGNENNYHKAARERELESLGRALKLTHVALTFVPSFADRASDIYLNGIDQQASNTFLVYKRSRVIASYMDLKPVPENFSMLRAVLDSSVNEYFYQPGH